MEHTTAADTDDFIEHYPDGKTKLCGQMRDGLLHGHLKLYGEDGSLIMRANYARGELHGRLRIYAANQLSQVIKYARDKKHGTAYSFSNSRQLQAKEFFHEDKLQGKALYFHDNGKVAKETHYQRGLQHGDEKLFDPEGKLVAEQYYENDRLITKPVTEETPA